MKYRGQVLRLLCVSRNVSNLAEAIAFYSGALGFSVTNEALIDDPAWSELMGIPGARGYAAILRLGEQELELLTFNPPGHPYPSASRSIDLWFQHLAIVVADMKAAYAQLCRHPLVAISECGPQRLPPNTGSVIAFKFRDPDGHPLELIQFPPGTGYASWQQKQGIFLGIDHSAVDIADMDQSLDFYTGSLGLSVASRSINSGLEQERLDDTSDVVVEVVALHPGMEGPPHVELLGYEKPTGRPIPASVKANDLLADRLVLQVDELPRLVEVLKAEGAEFISPGIITLRDGHCAALLRDPTGHMLMLCA
jgi:catechol 2,3-dioxygenase-like lactoylglutathione lyase family enzyme